MTWRGWPQSEQSNFWSLPWFLFGFVLGPRGLNLGFVQTRQALPHWSLDPDVGSTEGSEISAPSPLWDAGLSLFTPPPPFPANIYYFLLLAVSSNKLRLITRPPGWSQTCLLFENSLLHHTNQ